MPDRSSAPFLTVAVNRGVALSAERRLLPMIAQLPAIALTAFAVVMAAAAVEDFRRLIIPNLLPILLCVLWPVHFAVAPSLADGLTALGYAVAVFLVGAVLFARGFLGGGDVKLLAAATLWAGPTDTPALLVLTGVLGGALALFLLMPFGAQLVSAGRTLLTPSSASSAEHPAMAVPYGVAIAAAALIVTLSPHLG
jgi:prepilin peptidase CpaA